MLPQCDNVSVLSISREEIAEAAWLAGMLDGEGSMMLQYVASVNRYYVQISVSNTNPLIIQRISQIWSRHNIKFAYSFQRRNGKRDYLMILSNGMGGAKKVLELVLPYLTAKRKQAELLLSFITWRQAQGYHVTARLQPEYRAMGEKVQKALHDAKYQDFNLHRLQRTASKPLQFLDEGIVESA